MYVTGISPGLLYKGSHLLNKGSWSLILSWDLGPVSKWSLRQDLLLKLRHVNDSGSRFLSLSSKSCLKLHLETGPWSSPLDCLQLHLGRSPYHAGLDACDNNQHPVVTVMRAAHFRDVKHDI